MNTLVVVIFWVIAGIVSSVLIVWSCYECYKEDELDLQIKENDTNFNDFMFNYAMNSSRKIKELHEKIKDLEHTT